MKRLIGAILILLSIASALCAAEASEIVERMEEVMDFDSAVFSSTMVNRDRLGETTLTFDTYEKGDGDTLLIVTAGADRGQKMLRLEDDIYIYYPDADEVIRLSGSALKNSFLGSDFSYEDLTGDDDYDERYELELAGMEEFGGRQCYHVVFIAKQLSETYQRQEMLIDSERYVPLKSSLMSRSGRLLKEIYFSDYIEGEALMPGRIEVVNAVKKGSSSLVTITDCRFNTRLDESLFSKEELSW